MTGKEAKNILAAARGLFILSAMQGVEPAQDFAGQFSEAVTLAVEAIDMMDNRLELEKGDDNK